MVLRPSSVILVRVDAIIEWNSQNNAVLIYNIWLFKEVQKWVLTNNRVLAFGKFEMVLPFFKVFVFLSEKLDILTIY